MTLVTPKTRLRLCAGANGAYPERRVTRVTRVTNRRRRVRHCGFDYRSALRRLRPDLAAKLDKLVPRRPINGKDPEILRTLLDDEPDQRRSEP